MINFGIKFFVSPTLEWHDEHYIFLSSLLSWKSTIFLHLSPNSMLSTSLIIAVCRMHVIMNLENGLTHCEVFVAQWLEHSLSVWEVIWVWIPSAIQTLFFVPPKLMTWWTLHLTFSQYNLCFLASLFLAIGCDYVQHSFHWLWCIAQQLLQDQWNHTS